MYWSGCSGQKTHLLQYTVSRNALYVAYLLTACGKNLLISSMEFTITAWRKEFVERDQIAVQVKYYLTCYI